MVKNEVMTKPAIPCFEKPFPVDIDFTLIYDLEDPEEEEETVQVTYAGQTHEYGIHWANIARLQHFYVRGYDIVFWSRTGMDWAKAVVEALGLSKYARAYSAKPLYYMDDKDCEEWMGNRVYEDLD